MCYRVVFSKLNVLIRKHNSYCSYFVFTAEQIPLLDTVAVGLVSITLRGAETRIRFLKLCSIYFSLTCEDRQVFSSTLMTYTVYSWERGMCSSSVFCPWGRGVQEVAGTEAVTCWNTTAETLWVLGAAPWPMNACSKGQENADVPQFHVGLGNPGVVLAMVVYLCYSINDSVLWKSSWFLFMWDVCAWSWELSNLTISVIKASFFR